MPGNIEYHYFAGYSGGSKAIMPGVSTHDAIQANHKRMVDERAHAGNLDTNPVRIDIDEVGSFVHIDFIVNVVLDEHKKIRHCVAGHYIEAHRAGCRLLDKLYQVAISAKADIVVTSPGGFPKDLNIYQAQKALDNAKHAVRDGGVIVWLAAAGEGLGEATFEKWMLGHEKSRDMIDTSTGNLSSAAIRRRRLQWCWKNAAFSLSVARCGFCAQDPFGALCNARRGDGRSLPRDGEGCKGARHALWRLDAAGAGESCMTGFS